MGVHDFISYIQRNGQDIYGLALTGSTDRAVTDPEREKLILAEEVGSDRERDLIDEDPSDEEYVESDNGEGSITSAVLVRVPKTYSVKTIHTWPLSEFGKFPHIETFYSYDSWSFDFQKDDTSGEYFEYEDNLKDQGIWESSQYPNEWLVCFLRKEYKVFVLECQMIVLGDQEVCNKIPRRYYTLVFEARDLAPPVSKKDAFAVIQNNFKTTNNSTTITTGTTSKAEETEDSKTED